jgi:PIN domain nuclease of toxin-antitoxin system
LRLLLDSTYLLPAIGVSIKELPKDVLTRLIQKGNRIFICDISIFELSAKGAKHVSAGALPAERVTRGIRAIVYSEAIETIPMYDSALLLTAFKLRSMLNDFVDCLILSAAINRCDILLTQDRDIQELQKNKEFNELRMATNSKFKIQSATETLQLQR